MRLLRSEPQRGRQKLPNDEERLGLVELELERIQAELDKLKNTLDSRVVQEVTDLTTGLARANANDRRERLEIKAMLRGLAQQNSDLNEHWRRENRTGRENRALFQEVLDRLDNDRDGFLESLRELLDERKGEDE